MKADITNYGGKVVSLFVPDKDGQLSDIVQGFNDIDGYLSAKEPYFGALIGRYGNRIAQGKFSLDGREYTLATNNGAHHLHGGLKGFNAVVWDAVQKDDQTLELSYLSPDGEEGYPGNLNVKVRYELSNENSFRISYEAETDATTIINLTHHSFFNLSGNLGSSINDHILSIYADGYTPVDEGLIPTGTIEPVANTPFDFRSPKSIGKDLETQHPQLLFGKGYDHNFVLNKAIFEGGLHLAAKVLHPASGREMEVWTTEPGLQFYSGNFLNGEDIGKAGIAYPFRSAFCLETQHFPDSPNQPAFPSTLLRPGAMYKSTTEYRFDARQVGKYPLHQPTNLNNEQAHQPMKKLLKQGAKNLTTSNLTLLLTLLLSILYSEQSQAQNRKKSNLALTPPMGWNSWNTFRCDGLNEQLVKDMADIISTNGMKEAGYEYVNLDDCWQIGRYPDGRIMIDSVRFPSGIKALADYVHSKGLKLGIYSDAGLMTCAKRPGSFRYEEIDAQTYAEWGIDYLKYDFCNLPLELDQSPEDKKMTPFLRTALKGPTNYTAEQIYLPMAAALAKQNRDIVFSICNWGVQEPWKWAGEISHLWRTTPDIRPYFKGFKLKYAVFMSTMEIINRAHKDQLHLYAGPGRWNDPDMLEVGNGKMTYPENVAQFSMWAMMAAPLLAGNDLRTMSPEVLGILTNKAVIAVNQDSLGKQGYKLKEMDGVQVWLKPLSGERWAICLLNPNKEKTISFNWADLQLNANYTAYDLWDEEAFFTAAGITSIKVPKHGVRMLELK